MDLIKEALLAVFVLSLPLQMSSAHKQPLGWTPSSDEESFLDGDSYEAYQPNQYPFSPSSSTSSLCDIDVNNARSGGSSRRSHEPGWVARPRNAFIIFRCEYSQLHSRQGRRIRRPPGTSTEPTLSKRAAIAWSQMSQEEKEPYKVRAEEERNDHSRKYPNYRFRPQRRPGAGRRYSTRLATYPHSYPSPESTPEPLTSSNSPVYRSRPSTSDGSSTSDVDAERRWTLPFAYTVPENTKPALEIQPIPYNNGQYHGLPTPNSPTGFDKREAETLSIHIPSPIVPAPPTLLSWHGDSFLDSHNNNTIIPETLNHLHTDNLLDHYSSLEYVEPHDTTGLQQYSNVDSWSSTRLMHYTIPSPGRNSYDLHGVDHMNGTLGVYDSIAQASPLCDYPILLNNPTVCAGLAVASDYFATY